MVKTFYIVSSIGSTQVYCFARYFLEKMVIWYRLRTPRSWELWHLRLSRTQHLIVVQRRQPSRKTRPPVGSSELMHHPYVSGASLPLKSKVSKYRSSWGTAAKWFKTKRMEGNIACKRDLRLSFNDQIWDGRGNAGGMDMDILVALPTQVK